MVRMREVLKSIRDVKQPGQSEPADDQSGSQDADKSFSFPARELKPRTDDAPAPSIGDTRIGKSAPRSGTDIKGFEDSEKKDLYHEAIKAIDEFLKLAGSGEPFDLDAVAQKADQFADALSESDYLFTISLSFPSTAFSMSQHSVNVAIVGIKIALGMRYSREKVLEVGLATMVHGVGMVRVPGEILAKKSGLDETEIKIIKQHPIHGKAILEAMRDEYPFLPDVVAQEHERWDGSGYPFGLKENDIHIYAQIIGLSDTFVALTSHRHYRDNFIAYKAIQSIIERRNKDFSAKLIKTLIDVISIFPVGSFVRLNDGSVARVIRTHKQYPIRPVIEIIQDSLGETVANTTVLDLSKEPMIYIVSPILDITAYT